MDFNYYAQVISGIQKIGDAINSWRTDVQARTIHDPKEFKTEADSRAHKLISDLLTKFDEKAFIVSEEDIPESSVMPDEYWLIDPIDGTASWYEGYDGFVTQIAYIKKRKPVFGVVCAPALSKTWWAVAGKGAYLNGKRLNIRSCSSENLKLIDNYSEPRRIAKTIMQMEAVSEYIESGSLGLKSVLVADGTVDIFAKDVLIRDWDIAPAFVILNEVGASIKDLKGQEIPFHGSNEKENGLLVTANSSINRMVLDFLMVKSIDD